MLRRLLALPCTFFALTACGDDGGESASQSGTTSQITAPTTPQTSTPTTSGESASETDSAGSNTDGASATDTPETSTSSATSSTSTSASTADDTTTNGLKFDLGDTGDTNTSGGPVDVCKAGEEDMGNPGDCTMTAPPDAFEPAVQWTWGGPGGERESLVTPLVANLTDDNGDGQIDLCDVPDVVVTVTQFPNEGHIYVLSGDDGKQHLMIPTAVTWSINPAIADIDEDGIPEIVAATGPGFGGPSSAIAFEHDGTVKWQNASALSHGQGGAITLADLDNDGSAEIVVVSDAGFNNQQTAPTVQVIRDVEDRWIQPRRIWNQHTYHVTNVREDGTVPQFEKPWWQGLNTFRTNSQIEGGEICMPPPQ